MEKKTNAQVALECAVDTYVQGSSTTLSVLRRADAFKEWLDKNTDS